MITVESTSEDIRVTIPRQDMAPEQIEAILRPFRFVSLVSGSQMSQDEANRLAEESKAGWWMENGPRFESR
jgi:hypothetical protein